MDYMESVKQLEEKLVLNQQKHDCDGFTDGLCNGQVLLSGNFFVVCCNYLERGVLSQLLVIGDF